jgi:hypothetical protein
MANETPNFGSKQELQDYINSLKEIDAQYQSLNRQAKELASVPGSAKNAILKQLKALREQYDTHKEILTSIKQAESELKNFTKQSEKATKSLEAQAKAVDDLSDNFSELDTFQRSITRRYGEQSDETKRINKNVDAIKAATGGVGKFLKKNVNLEEDQRDALIEASEYLKSMPSSFDKLNKQVSRGTINQKKYNYYVAELNDNWEEILDKIDDSDKSLRGLKKSLKGFGYSAGLSAAAGMEYEKFVKRESESKEAGLVASTALAPIPGGEGLAKLIEAREYEKMSPGSSSAKILRAMGALAIGAGIGDFLASMRYQIKPLSEFLNSVANDFAPDLAAATGEVNVQQAKFNRNFRLSNQLGPKYQKQMYYAAEATKEFDFQMKDLANQFSKSSKTAFLGRGIGSIAYSASKMELAGVGAESVGNALTDIASTSNVNFFGTTLGSQAAVFSKQMGISTQSIGNIMAAFRRIDGSSGATALNMVYTSAEMADIAKLNPAVILQDMAEASGKMLSYNIQNAKSFQQQAISIRQMGGNLPRFAEGIRGSIINYRESLQSQIALSNILNRPVDFSVAQSLAYQGKYSEAFANIRQSGVLDAVRKGGMIAENEFSKIFGMGLDEFQARAEGGKSIGLKKTMDAENKSFLERVSNAELGFQIKAAEIRFDKAIIDAQFGQTLATELEKTKAYRDAVNRVSDLQAGASKLESMLYGILTAAASIISYGLLGKIFKGGVATSSISGAKPATAGPGAGLGGNFAGYKITGTGANQLVRNAKGQIVSAAEAKAFKDASKLAKYSKFANVAGKGLGVLGVGLDVYGRVSEGQTMTQTAAGVGTSMAGAYGGAQLGAYLGAFGGPLAPFTVPLGGLIGGIGGYFAGGKVSDMVTGVGKPKTTEQTQQTQQVQESLDSTTQLLTVVKNIELLVAEMAGYQATPAVVQMIMDGKDISNSLVKHQLNSRGQKKQTTLKQSLGWYR